MSFVLQIKTFSSLREHIQYVDTKDGLKIKCYFCDKLFVPKEMETHLRVHTREKPFACEYCLQDFAVKNQLGRHKGSKHADTKEGKQMKMFYHRQCYFCSKTYQRQYKLFRHMKFYTKEVY